MKLLLVFAAVALLVWLLRGDRRRAVQQKTRQQRSAAPRAVAGPERMVGCAACGLHLPAGDALVDHAGRPFCCEAHRRSAG